MSKGDFFGGISKPVNESLAKIFIKLGLIEQTGHGVTAIVDKYGKEAFAFLDHFIRVTIPFNYELDEFIKARGDVGGAKDGASDGTKVGIKDAINKNQDVIEKNNENVTLSDEKTGEFLGDGASDGASDGARVVKDISDISDEEKIISAIKNNPKITTADMMGLIGKSRRTVTRIIAKSTKIERVGTSFDGYWKIKN